MFSQIEPSGYVSGEKGPKFTGLGITNMRICCFYVFTITVNCMSLGVHAKKTALC